MFGGRTSTWGTVINSTGKRQAPLRLATRAGKGRESWGPLVNSCGSTIPKLDQKRRGLQDLELPRVQRWGVNLRGGKIAGPAYATLIKMRRKCVAKRERDRLTVVWGKKDEEEGKKKWPTGGEGGGWGGREKIKGGNTGLEIALRILLLCRQIHRRGRVEKRALTAYLEKTCCGLKGGVKRWGKGGGKEETA